MQLRKVVGAILNDLSEAQALANDYSNHLSYKYRRKGSGKDGNNLNNFRVPSTVLSEISLELKFIIQEINSDDVSLDVEKNQEKCGDLAAQCIISLYNQLSELAKKPEIVREILTPEFIKKLEMEISQALFDLYERFFISEEDLTLVEVKNTIVDRLETELLQRKSIQKIPELQFEVNSSSDLINELARVRQARGMLRSICLSSAEATTKETDILTIVQTTVGSPNTHIVVNSEDLKNIPAETIQRLQINAKYTNQRWIISESKLT